MERYEFDKSSVFLYSMCPPSSSTFPYSTLHTLSITWLPAHHFLFLNTATECRTFLLYCVPLLHGSLPDKFLAHALLLSKGIRILLGDQISHSEVDMAEHLLCLFWKLTEEYYGKHTNYSYMTLIGMHELHG